MNTLKRPVENVAPSSSPAFGTPLHPILPAATSRPPPPPAFKAPVNAPILPILIPPPTLRPFAFRSFTKKHNLTLSASALGALATFVGRHCGSRWREEGTGEKVLEEAAKLWKNENGGVIVEDGNLLRDVLKALEGCMSGGRVMPIKGSKESGRQNSFAFANDSVIDLRDDNRPGLERQGSSFGISGLRVEGDTDEDESHDDPHAWLRIISAFDQPRILFDSDKKHFVPCAALPSAFPPVSEKTVSFRQRYSQIHQRVLRNPAFQAPSLSMRSTPSLVRQGSTITPQQFYRVTPITNLLGRGGTSHLLLGLLAMTPTGLLAIHDPSGSITLDLSNASPLQGEDSAYFVPGMIVLIDGIYEESWAGAGSTGLGNTGGVGGLIGGRFVGFGIGGPPVERRDISLGINLAGGEMGAGLGWTDFLGHGSEKGVGERMRRLESRLLSVDGENACSEARRKTIVLGEVCLDDPATLPALRKVLQSYSSPEMEAPMTFILTGNFTSQSTLAGAGMGSIEYKDLFDALAAVLSDFPNLLASSTWMFVPGDRDPWASAFSAGASTMIPRQGVPDIFTSRIKRAFANAKSDVGSFTARSTKKREGEAVWTSNPARFSVFGPCHEVVVFRDDMASRFRRSAIRVGTATKQKQDTPQGPAIQSTAESEDDVVMSGALPGDPEDQTSLEPESRGAAEEQQSWAISQARKLILSLLPQSHLSPFPASTRPTHWSYQSALSLYPLPHSLFLVDAQAEPFAVTFEGCHVLNPGKMVGEGARRKKVIWAEYDAWTKRGILREDWA